MDRFYPIRDGFFSIGGRLKTVGADFRSSKGRARVAARSPAARCARVSGVRTLITKLITKGWVHGCGDNHGSRESFHRIEAVSASERT